MSVMFWEKPRSRSGARTGRGRVEVRNCFCMGAATRLEVEAAALAGTPAVDENGLTRGALAINSVGYDLWDVDVPYSSVPPDGLTPDVLGFKITAGTAHITQSRETKFRRRAADNDTPEPPAEPVEPFEPVPPEGPPNPADYDDQEFDPQYIIDLENYENAYAGWEADHAEWETAHAEWVSAHAAWVSANAGWIGTAPDTKGAIGLDGETIAGCDIVVPQMEFSYSTQRSSIDLPYLITLFNMVGKTNNAPFLGFAKGTLLYLGAEPTSAQVKLLNESEVLVWNLAHQFKYSPNRVTEYIADVKVPKIGGHEYLWVRYSVDSDAGALTRPPKYVNVERVYDEGNFELLEIAAA